MKSFVFVEAFSLDCLQDLLNLIVLFLHYHFNNLVFLASLSSLVPAREHLDLHAKRAPHFLQVHFLIPAAHVEDALAVGQVVVATCPDECILGASVLGMVLMLAVNTAVVPFLCHVLLEYEVSVVEAYLLHSLFKAPIYL